MIEIPALAVIFFAIALLSLGFTFGRAAELATRDGRRRRALRGARPIWEVQVVSDGPKYEFLDATLGDRVIVLIQQVKRAKGHEQVLQKIEIARLRPDEASEKLLDAVDRANTTISTLALAGAA